MFALKIAAATWGYSHKYEVIKELQEFHTNTYFKLKSKNEPQREMLKAIHYTLNCYGTARGVNNSSLPSAPRRISSQASH